MLTHPLRIPLTDEHKTRSDHCLRWVCQYKKSTKSANCKARVDLGIRYSHILCDSIILSLELKLSEY